MRDSLPPSGVALVTGAGQGIGRAIALRLARDGYAVALVDINADALSRISQELEALDAPALAVEADLAEPAQVRRAVDAAVAWGPLTALVNNAGRVFTTPFFDITEDEWDAVMTLDLKAVFFVMQFAGPHVQPGGRIVNVASMSGRLGRIDQAHYAAAKAGVISLTRSAALAFAPRNINVNAVCPGVVDTPMTTAIHEARAARHGITPEESLTRMLAGVPLGRIETPEDVAGAVSFLCSPDAAYITGQALNVCGGVVMS